MGNDKIKAITWERKGIDICARNNLIMLDGLVLQQRFKVEIYSYSLTSNLLIGIAKDYSSSTSNLEDLGGTTDANLVHQENPQRPCPSSLN